MNPNAAASLERLEQIECEMRKPGHAPFPLCVKWAEELATLRQSLAQHGESLTDTFVQHVPDKCDRITWRGHYYHLPITHPAAVDEAEVARIAAHIGNAVEYIEKAYPGTKTLDAGPILRNMRRWHKKLTAALQPATSEGENNG